jgi:hypothetical protein
MGSLYGFEVKSELPLQRLNAAAGTRGELVIAKAATALTPPDREPTGLRVTDDGYRWFAAYELDGGECLLQMPPTGSFLLQPAGGRILVEPTDGDGELLEHRIASAAVCTLLSMRADLVLHAAAIEAGGRAIVFCGPSLRGKSTLARALAGAGCRLLAEDGIAIGLSEGAAIAQPGARGVRIRRRHGNGSLRAELLADPGPGEPPPCPVAAVVLLGERGDAFEAEPLARARALTLLTPNLIHSGGRVAIATAFQRLASVLGRVPAFRVSLADDLDLLADGAAGLLDAAGVDD